MLTEKLEDLAGVSNRLSSHPVDEDKGVKLRLNKGVLDLNVPVDEDAPFKDSDSEQEDDVASKFKPFTGIPNR